MSTSGLEVERGGREEGLTSAVERSTASCPRSTDSGPRSAASDLRSTRPDRVHDDLHYWDECGLHHRGVHVRGSSWGNERSRQIQRRKKNNIGR